MMSFRVGLIAPYPDLANLAHEVCKDLNEQIDIYEGDLGAGVKIAQKMQDQDMDVIISRGGTALAIEKAVDVPVVSIQVTGFDIVRAIHSAKQFQDVIGVVGFRNIIYGTESVEDILGVSLKFIYLESEGSADEQIASAIEGGLRVIVGDAIATKIASRYGAKGVLIESGKEAIVKALEEAKHVAAVRRHERQRAEELQAILDFAYEGIMAIDQNGVIKAFNPIAGRLLGISTDKALGKHITEVVPEIGFDLVRSSRRSDLGRIQRIGNTVIVGNRIPITVDREVVGAVFTFQDVVRIQEVEKEARRKLYLSGHVAKHTFDDILTKDDNMYGAVDLAKKFAATESTVLIIGETGTGKELFAQSIHNESRRSDGPFVAINCAALPESLLESELFGYEEGAFTGSRKGGKPGLFELAHGGTIFLDEIGDMCMSTQARLLRVLEQREVMPLGGKRIIPVDVRVIAATHRNLKKLVNDGTFRADLYYRLNVLNITIPPLRERFCDVSLLASYFLQVYGADLKEAPKTFTDEALEVLEGYTWPGNVRELRNICERLAVAVDADKIARHDVLRLLKPCAEAEKPSIPTNSVTVSIEGGLRQMEEEIMRQVLQRVGGDKTQASRLLGVSRSTIWRRLSDNG